jgi:hypothetical protein
VARVPDAGAVAVYRGWMLRAAQYAELGPAVLRDCVKSMTHYWHEAAYIPDLAGTASAGQVAARLRELGEDEFTGGFVLRRFEHFTSAEASSWWVGGACRLITPHPDTPGDSPPDIDLSPFTAPIRSLGLPFVTADLARRADGTWRVSELGGGPGERQRLAS